MIPAEAVEAAAEVVKNAHPFQSMVACRAEARAALEAAAPYMLAEAWAEGHDAGFTYGAFQGRVQESPNPYMLNNEGEK